MCVRVDPRTSTGFNFDTTNLGITSLPYHERFWYIVIGGRHFWLFGLFRAAEYVLYTYLIHHVHTLCACTTTGVS